MDVNDRVAFSLADHGDRLGLSMTRAKRRQSLIRATAVVCGNVQMTGPACRVCWRVC
jgi:hypothetical protein